MATTIRRRVAAVWVLYGAAALACAAPSVHLEELTWTEVRDQVASGTTTILIPIGGTEQNGPHMVLGKHNVRVRALSAKIATALGQTLVAPVLSYVPEGSISPPSAHMRYAGTISVPEAAFEAVIEAASRSFRQHGFRDVVLLGDHGGYAASLARVASRLNREWAGERLRLGAAPGTQVHALAEYYAASTQGHAKALAERGHGASQIGNHAGLADTSLALAIDPTLVRSDQLARAANGRDGVVGEPASATAALGAAGVTQVVEASVAAIRARLRRP